MVAGQSGEMRSLSVAFRADASLQIGIGHIMRCLSLADALRERGASCSFVCRPHQGNLLAMIAERGHRALSLPKQQAGDELINNGTAHSHWLGTNWATDVKDTQVALSAYAGGKLVDWLVVDHYSLDARWEKMIRPQAKRIMVIDDLADRPHDCDLLLDQNLGRKEADYGGLLKGNPINLVGPQYMLMRPEFAALRAQSLARRQSTPRLQRLLVSMGGVDKENATGRVLATLQSCNLPTDLRVIVVMGPHAPWLERVKSQVAQMHCQTELLVDVDNLAQLMADSDLAIGAAGGTAWERCCLGLPSLVLALARNQLLGVEALQNTGAAVAIETQYQIATLLNSLHTADSAQEWLAKLSKSAAAVTDGLGCQRVAECLRECAHA